MTDLQSKPQNRSFQAVNASIWPTSLQETLLHAALSTGQVALEAWQAWKPNFEHGTDLGSFRLMPLVYHNLSKQGLDDSMLGRLRGIYRKAWVENQILFAQLAEVLSLLQTAGIPVMLLKGVPMSLLYYKNPGLRPMADCDIAVHPNQRDDAIRVLTQAGWKPKLDPPTKITPAYLDALHAHSFVNERGIQMDLHWHISLRFLSPTDDKLFWEGSVPMRIQNINAVTLNPTDMLFHTLDHGIRWDIVASLRWITDAMAILGSPEASIDWARLINLARQRQQTLTFFTALNYLQQNFSADIPSEVLKELEQVRASWFEKVEFFAFTRHSRLYGLLLREWCAYQRHWNRAVFGGPFGFFRYLGAAKGLENFQQTLGWVYSRLVFRLRLLFTKSSEFTYQGKDRQADVQAIAKIRKTQHEQENRSNP